VGNGTTTFKLPDLRGVFVRGYEGTGTRDPDKNLRIRSNGTTGNGIGSLQSAGMGQHNHASSTFNSSPASHYHNHSDLSTYTNSHTHDTGRINWSHSHSHDFDFIKYSVKSGWKGNGGYYVWETYQDTPATLDATTSQESWPSHTSGSTSGSTESSHGHGVNAADPYHVHSPSVSVANYNNATETRPKNVYVNYIIKI
jgi:hypothetical protein